jgi:hypothetical protein
MNLLREYIRELLTEAAMGPTDLPEGISVAIEPGSGAEVRIYYAAEDPLNSGEWMRADMLYRNPRGSVAISSVPRVASRAGMGECGGAWELYHAEATSGWGPLLYDVAMEYATQNGGGLISDRGAVSPAARNVWDYYFSNRGDVTGIQLDDLQNTLTPEEEDNCVQRVASYTNHHGMPKNIDWQTSPLSKRYTKPPTTMNALEAAGKLVML